MRVTINPQLDIESLTWVENDGVYEYEGPVVWFGGPSAEAKANESAQTAFYQAVTQQQQQTFSEHQDMYNLMVGITSGIIAKGPQQYGYTPEVDALLRSNIESTSDAATASTINATKLAEQQKAGGAAVLPTGASAQLEEDARVLGEQTKATNLSNEKLSGYAAGEQLYQNALNNLSGTIGSPTSYTTAATGAGSGATSAINLADSERSTLLSSLLGGAIQGGLGFATGGASNILAGGSFLSGASSKNG
jgi:hypothetical protein